MAKFSTAIYNILAGNIAAARQEHPEPDAQAGLDCLVSRLAKTFAADNPNFARERFEKAARQQPECQELVSAWGQQYAHTCGNPVVADGVCAIHMHRKPTTTPA